MGGVGAALQRTYDVLVKGETPSAPAIAPPPPPPGPNDSDVSKAQDEAAAKEAARRTRGRASTMLTGGAGDTSQATTAGRTLLGG